MLHITKKFNRHDIHCTAVKMGNDFNISIYGGDKAHIGAVALGIPRPSLEDNNKISSSVSLLTITGHKEDIIAQKCAKILSSKLNSTVVVACGIHIKNIAFQEIQALNTIIDQITDDLVLQIKKHN